MAWKLSCPTCGYAAQEGEYKPFCPICGSPLSLEGEIHSKRVLGEGNTPAIKREYSGADVVFKLEYLNPSGSFKDRGVAVSLHIAVELGYECVVEDSSGNTGLSVATYANALGLEANIVVPRSISQGKLALLRALGAHVHIVDTREDAADAARWMSGDCFYVAHAYSPVFIEGVSSIAVELSMYADYDFLVPVSSGTLVLGLYRGFRRVGIKPRLIAVQPTDASPLRSHVDVLAVTGEGSSKLADALVVKRPPRLAEIASAIKDSGGGLVVVDDAAIRESLRELLSMGLIVEPSSAAAWAAFKALRELREVEKAVVPLTGSGLKYAGVLARIAEG